jgi:hypothetical protein
MSDNPNWGGARKGAGRPKEVTKIEDNSTPMLMMISIPGKFWDEFKSLVPPELIERDEDFRRFAHIIMMDGMHKYIRSRKRAQKAPK